MSAEELSARFGWRATDGEGESAGVGATPSGPVVLPAGLREKLLAFAADAAPNECCGIGIGPSGRISEFHPLPNVHEAPVTRYQIAAGDQMRVFKAALDRGWDFTLVFHSHPATEPYPSVTDVSLAGWPDAVYVIAGLAGGARLRAYRIVQGRISELEIAVGPSLVHPAAPLALTGKQRRTLRALGHALDPVVRVGQKGVTPEVLDAVRTALEDHELIKVKLAEGDEDREAVAARLAGETGAELAQVLGRTALLYKRREENPRIEI